jgi:hypothetical protein
VTDLLDSLLVNNLEASFEPLCGKLDVQDNRQEAICAISPTYRKRLSSVLRDMGDGVPVAELGVVKQGRSGLNGIDLDNAAQVVVFLDGNNPTVAQDETGLAVEAPDLTTKKSLPPECKLAFLEFRQEAINAMIRKFERDQKLRDTEKKALEKEKAVQLGKLQREWLLGGARLAGNWG